MRRLNDDELRMLARKHIGLTSEGAAEVFESELSVTVEDVCAVVAPFLANTADPAALREAIGALAPGLDFPYKARVNAILSETKYGPCH
jgi:hypothetical protein